MNGNISFSYKFFANFIQLGSESDAPPISVLIIPPSQTNPSAKKLADIIIIIHNIPNMTNLIHSFILSSEFEVIILYPPKKAIAIHITINISIAYQMSDFTCFVNKSDHLPVSTSLSIALSIDVHSIVASMTPSKGDASSAKVQFKLKILILNADSINVNNAFLIDFISRQ
jgi:hypothetical protein